MYRALNFSTAMLFLTKLLIKQFLFVLLSFIFLCAFVFTVKAEVTLPSVFLSNMVLQRDLSVKLWGCAEKREEIAVFFHGNTTHVKADKKGKWNAELRAFPAGGPFELIISGKNEIKLTNILVGDVWVRKNVLVVRNKLNNTIKKLRSGRLLKNLSVV